VADSQTLNPDGTDPSRTYSRAEQQKLTENLTFLTERIHRGEFSQSPLSEELLSFFHRTIFDGVRSHAGKMRAKGFGAERLVFGPHRSALRDDVPKEVTAIFEKTNKLLRPLESNTSEPNYDEECLRLAVWVHAKVIQIHPFEDGNGRSSRALLSYLLVRLGLRPIPLERPKNEYLDAMNLFFVTQEIQPLLDVYMALSAGFLIL
jgi:fido (protein-threonine AMPylation protein)